MLNVSAIIVFQKQLGAKRAIGTIDSWIELERGWLELPIPEAAKKVVEGRIVKLEERRAILVEALAAAERAVSWLSDARDLEARGGNASHVWNQIALSVIESDACANRAYELAAA